MMRDDYNPDARRAEEGPQSGDINGNEHHVKTDHLMWNLKGRAISSGFVIAVAQGVQFVLNLVWIMVLARLLTPSDFGLVAMVTTIVAFLRVFQDAGLSIATVQREGITHAQVSNLFWINLAVGGFATLLTAGAAPAIAWFYRDDRLIGITLALASTFVLTGLAAQHVALLNRQMRFKAVALIQMSSFVAGAVVGIGMAWFKFGYWSLVASNLTTVIASLLLTWTICSWRPQMPSTGSGIRPILTFGVSFAAGGFLYSLVRGADSLLIGRFYGAVAVGIYSRASVLVFRPMDQFLSPISSVFLPTLARLQIQPQRYRRTFLRLFEAIVLVSFSFTALLLALAHPLTLVVLGPKWENTAAIFAAFTLVALYFPLSNVATWLFISQGRGSEGFVSTAIACFIMVASFASGLPWGPVGVAVAYGAGGILLQLPVLYYLAGRRGPVTSSDLRNSSLKFLPVWSVVCGATYLIRMRVPHFTPLRQLLICGPAGLLIAAGCICVYPPARRTALGLFDILRDFRRGHAPARPVPAHEVT
jgi:O-antigen/teichoic acid export membrane protein